MIAADAPPQIMVHHSLAAGDANLAAARAMIATAFEIQPADRPAPPVRTSRILEVIR